MTFDKFNRRTHLYLAMILLPWFFMFGVSGIPFNHLGDPPAWNLLSDHEYHLDPIPPDANLDELGAKLITDAGLAVPKRYGAFRNAQGNVQVYLSNFLHTRRVNYFPAKNRLVAEERQFRMRNFLTEMHTRAGYEKGGLLDHLWVFFVDVTGIAVVIWVLSGLYMWWHLRGHRVWGGIALAAGFATFILIVGRL